MKHCAYFSQNPANFIMLNEHHALLHKKLLDIYFSKNLQLLSIFAAFVGVGALTDLYWPMVLKRRKNGLLMFEIAQHLV